MKGLEWYVVKKLLPFKMISLTIKGCFFEKSRQELHENNRTFIRLT